MTEELFDVVDDQDRVLEQLPRSVVHRRKLLHRAVHVFLFNSAGELLLQMRSATKDEAPLTYTSSASGHLGAGEDYFPAAVRELQEEIGLSVPLEFIVKLPASPDLANEHTVLYRAESDEPPTFDPGECESVEFLSWAEIHRRMEQDLARFSWPFVTLFRWYDAQFGGPPRRETNSP